MAALVYILCALTSIGCTTLLLRAYYNKAVRLLLWAGLCFAALAVNNIILIFDLLLVPQMDLALPRNLAALVGVALLLYGLVWDVRE
jgi:hypothetical protein